MDLRLTKPVDAKLLLSTIDQLCGGKAGENVTESQVPDPLNIVVPLSRTARPNVDVIDQTQFEYLLSIGDDVFVRGMVEGFLQDADETLDPLRQAVNQRKVHDFRFFAHAIKSSSNNMGAKTLAELCGHLEKITEADFDEHRFVYLDKIEIELGKVIEALQTLTADQSQPLPRRSVS
jgi:two-component system sensor histidine kinase RpfC